MKSGIVSYEQQQDKTFYVLGNIKSAIKSDKRLYCYYMYDAFRVYNPVVCMATHTDLIMVVTLNKDLLKTWIFLKGLVLPWSWRFYRHAVSCCRRIYDCVLLHFLSATSL